MASDYGALCTDFYVNQKLALKLDLPTSRETVLDMFDRVRRELPSMDRFRRYDGELALESAELNREYSWLALRQTSIRSGWVNPETLGQAYRLHRLILEVAPYFLSISPLDIEYLELVFGFDLEATTNRDEAVFEALLRDSPLSALVDPGQESLLDMQPVIGMSLNDSCDLQAYLEVKTRTTTNEVATGRFGPEPISIYLTIRRQGPLTSIKDIAAVFGALAGHAERLAEQRVIPHMIVPIRQAILSRPG